VASFALVVKVRIEFEIARNSAPEGQSVIITTVPFSVKDTITFFYFQKQAITTKQLSTS